MNRTLLLCIALLVGSVLLGAFALWCAQGAHEELARPAERTRLVYRFDRSDGADALDLARDVMRKRLRDMKATEITVERRGESEVVAEFRPLQADPADMPGKLGRRLAARGTLRFLVAASGAEFDRPGSPLNGERAKFEGWRAAHPNDSLDAFHALAPEAGGPAHGLRWCPLIRRHPDDSDPISASLTAAARSPIPLLAPKAEWTFGAADLQSVSMSPDELGYPAVAFELMPDRASAFGDFTASIVNQGLAIVLDGEIVVLANVQSRLPGSGIINGGAGGFSASETNSLIAVLRSGELPSSPVLVASERFAAPRASSWLVLAVVSFVAAASSIALVVLALVSAWRTLRAVRSNSAAIAEDWSS